MDNLIQFIKFENDHKKQEFQDYLDKLIFQQAHDNTYQLVFPDLTFNLTSDVMYQLMKNKCPIYNLIQKQKIVTMDTEKNLTILLVIHSFSLNFKSKYMYDVLTIDDKYFQFFTVEKIVNLLTPFKENMLSSKVSDAVLIAWLALRPYALEEFKKQPILFDLLEEFMDMYPYSIQTHWLNVPFIDRPRVQRIIDLIKNASDLKSIEKEKRKLNLLEDGFLTVDNMVEHEFGLQITAQERAGLIGSVFTRYQNKHRKAPKQINGVDKYVLDDYQIIRSCILSFMYKDVRVPFKHVQKINTLLYWIGNLNVEVLAKFTKALYDHYKSTDYFDRADFKIIFKQTLLEIIGFMCDHGGKKKQQIQINPNSDSDDDTVCGERSIHGCIDSSGNDTHSDQSADYNHSGDDDYAYRSDDGVW